MGVIVELTGAYRLSDVCAAAAGGGIAGSLPPGDDPVVIRGAFHSDGLPDGVLLSTARIRPTCGLTLRRLYPAGIFLTCTATGAMPAEGAGARATVAADAGRIALSMLYDDEPLTTRIIPDADYAGVGFRLPLCWLEQDEPCLRRLKTLLAATSHIDRSLPPSLRASILQMLDPPYVGTLGTLYRHGRGIDLMLDLIEQFTAEVSVLRPVSRLKVERVNHVREVIGSRIDDLPPLAELARMVGTNVRSLNLDFCAVMGMSVFAWAREQRMLLARRLLERNDLQVNDVADRIGFASPHNFTTAFRKRFGAPPGAFRR